LQERCFAFGPFRLYPSQEVLTEDGVPVRLGPAGLNALKHLIDNAGKTVSTPALAAVLWPGVPGAESGLPLQIAALRRVLGDGQSGRRFITLEPGGFYRFVATVEPSSGPLPPTLRSRTSTALLPARLTALVGRQATIGAVASKLLSSRLVTIVGPGGMGKTSVALAVAEVWNRLGDNETLFVDLAAVTNEAGLWTALLTAANAPSLGDAREAVLRALAGRRSLLLLDNCEHLLEPTATAAFELLAKAPSIRILATSREPLRTPGEVAYRLDPLASPAEGESVTADTVLACSAVELFVQRAKAIRSDFQLTDETAPLAGALCRRLDGLPLAIELAAARLDTLSLQALVEGIDSGLGVLGKNPGALPRQQTLTSVLAWSYDLLTSVEKGLLRRLSVFPAEFDLEAATAVGFSPGVPTAVYHDGLMNLVSKSLITADATGDEIRFRLLETTRAFARTALSAKGEETATLAALADHCLHRLKGSEGAGEAGLIAGWRRDRANVRVALDWALHEGEDPDLGLELVLAALPALLLLSDLARHRQDLGQALNVLHARQPDRRLDEYALEAAWGVAAYYLEGPTEASIGSTQTAFDIARTMDDTARATRACWMLYAHVANWGDYTRGHQVARDYVRLVRRHRQTRLMSAAYRSYARSLSELGWHRLAEQQFERHVLASTDMTPDPTMTAYDPDERIIALAVRARLRWFAGDVSATWRLAEASVEAGVIANHAHSFCWALAYQLIPVMIWSGRPDRARDFAAILLEQAHDTFNTWYEWGLLQVRALDAIAAGSGFEAVVSELEDAIPAQADLFATFHSALATDAALDRARDGRPSWCSPELVRIQAERDIARGDLGAADARLAEALVLARRQQARPWALRAALSACRISAADGRSLSVTELRSEIDRFAPGPAYGDLAAARALLQAEARP